MWRYIDTQCSNFSFGDDSNKEAQAVWMHYDNERYHVRVVQCMISGSQETRRDQLDAVAIHGHQSVPAYLHEQQSATVANQVDSRVEH